MRRRDLQVLALLLASVDGCAGTGPFSFDSLRQRAQALAAAPFEPATEPVPPGFLSLSYSDYQAIRFRPDRALWRRDQLPFQVEFFHPGSVHKDVVKVHELDAGEDRLVPFCTEAFSYGPNPRPGDHASGYAGVRLIHPVRGFGEVASFLGASYFRMVGRDQIYGASARGLALETSRPGQEEFPVFREFWLSKPGPDDRQARVFALLDSPSVAGAFEFILEPGAVTVATVTAALFPRREVKEFGVAPLTSMFLHDENSHPPNEDFRPEVHDSDGLLVHTSRGEWIWRPLEKGAVLRQNRYEDVNPQGFGLMQRDRDFEHYQDLVARYERRPSVWVKPIGNWGQGAVKLIQLPSRQEYWDNIVAFWIPASPPRPGTAFVVSYELHWLADPVVPEHLQRTRSTRLGQASHGSDPPTLRFVVDFEGSRAESLAADAPLQPDVRCGPGLSLVTTAVSRNTVNGTWRLAIETRRPDRAADLRACLTLRGEPVTETWHFTWQP